MFAIKVQGRRVALRERYRKKNQRVKREAVSCRALKLQIVMLYRPQAPTVRTKRRKNKSKQVVCQIFGSKPSLKSQ